MLLLKKLTFAPFFLIVFALLIYQLKPLLASYDFIFSLTLPALTVLAGIAVLISLSSLLFVLSAAIADDWRISITAAIIAASLAFVFIDPALATIFAVAVLISFVLSNLNLDVALKSYLTFQPAALLGPSIRHLSGLLILSSCLVYFFSSGKIIGQNGFQIPDSLIETAIKMAPLPETDTQTEQANLPQITEEQIELLKKNPDLLRQSGLDPKILDTLTQSQSSKTPQDLTHDLIKQTVKDQLQNFLKPYSGFVPAGLAVLLFVTLQFLTSVFNLLIYPLLRLVFFIMEKTGFVKFTTEMRPVKKLVV